MQNEYPDDMINRKNKCLISKQDPRSLKNNTASKKCLIVKLVTVVVSFINQLFGHKTNKYLCIVKWVTAAFFAENRFWLQLEIRFIKQAKTGY